MEERGESMLGRISVCQTWSENVPGFRDSNNDTSALHINILANEKHGVQCKCNNVLMWL